MMKKPLSIIALLLPFIYGVSARLPINNKIVRNTKKVVTSGDLECEIDTDDSSCETDLYAGQHTLVGTVTVDSGSDPVTVTYKTNPGWCMTETHLYVGRDAPTTSAPGQYPLKDEYEPDCLTEKTYEIYSCTQPLTGQFCLGEPQDECHPCLYVAAHAVVVSDRLGGFADMLPEPGTAKMILERFTVDGSDSYWDAKLVDSNGNDLLGVGFMDAWCGDNDLTIGTGTHCVQVYSSYDDVIPTGVFEHPYELDKVNYIINNFEAGMGSPGCGGQYTYGDIQRAIWHFLDEGQSTAGLGPWDACRVNEIVNDANANGEGYEPGCGDKIAIVLVPVDCSSGAWSQIVVAQVILGEVLLDCHEGLEETAWGDGPCEFGPGWGSYFKCCSPPPSPVKVAGVRFRSFANTGAGEIYLGVGDLGVGSNRVEKQYNWAKPGSYDITFEYNEAMNKLITTVERSDGTQDTLSYSISGELDPMDSCEIIVADRDTNSQVDFKNVLYDGVAVGSGNFMGNNAFAAYKYPLSGLDDGFEFAGTIDLAGSFSSSQEKSRVEILCGQNVHCT